MAVELSSEQRGPGKEIGVLPPLLIDVYSRFNLEPPRIPERPSERYPIITIIGPPGSGKTEAVKRIEARFGCQVLYERWQENEYVSGSYSRDDPEVALKSQIKFLLLKFQDWLKAVELSQEKPIILEPSRKMDNFYEFTFFELGKIDKEQHRQYLEINRVMEPFVFPEDLLISVIPDEATYNWRIKDRGRDYEQAGFTADFKRRMTELCLEEEKYWQSQSRCLCIGHLDYVHGDIDPVLLLGEFGLKATELWGQKEVLDDDGAKILCPEGWGNFKIGEMAPDNCNFKKDLYENPRT